MVDIYLTGIGEVVLDVPFPVVYIERPGFTSGLTLDANEIVEAGNFPTLSAFVIRHQVEQKKGENVGYFYRQATLGVKLTGVTDQRSIITAHFFGKAFRNPTTGQRIDGTL
jgi:hypothetical protein